MFEKVYSLKLGKIAVVPLAGTWIEMPEQAVECVPPKSFPSRERGLKLHDVDVTQGEAPSFPSRERGLK